MGNSIASGKSRSNDNSDPFAKRLGEPKIYQPPSIRSSFKSFSLYTKPQSIPKPFNRPSGPSESRLKLNYGSSITGSSFKNLVQTPTGTSPSNEHLFAPHNALVSRQTYPQTLISYDSLTQRPSRPMGIGSLPIKPVPAVDQRLPTNGKIVEVPTSYKLWTECYNKHRLNQLELDDFNTRIKNNTDELQRKNELNIHQLRLDQIRQTARLFSERESAKPALSIHSCLDINQRLQSLKKYDTKYFSPASKRPELTTAMLDTIKSVIQKQPSNEPIVELDGVQILRKDIHTLIGLNWLNDEIINAYMNLLVLRGSKVGYKKVYAFNTFFYPKLKESGYSSVRRWTRKVNIFSYDYIIVPVHLGNHWCLAFIDFTQKTISYYDSLGGRPNGACDTLLDYLRDESNDKRKQDFDDENWRLINGYSEGIPQQENCSDCGVFACTYAEYLTRNAEFDFGQEQMPYFRKKMIYEIITKKILE